MKVEEEELCKAKMGARVPTKVEEDKNKRYILQFYGGAGRSFYNFLTKPIYWPNMNDRIK